MNRISSSSNGAVSIGLIDNDPYASAHLRAAIDRLAPGFHVAWSVASGAAGVHRCLYAPRKPDVLVVDMSLADMTGTQVCAVLREHGSAIGVVGITALDPDMFRNDLARAGGQALVAKEDIPDSLRSAIEAAARGMARRGDAPFTDAADALGRVDAPGSGGAPLSERELAIIRLYARHMATRDIAETLGISESTIHVHMHHAMRKLHVASRQEVVRICVAQYRIR